MLSGAFFHARRNGDFGLDSTQLLTTLLRLGFHRAQRLPQSSEKISRGGAMQCNKSNLKAAISVNKPRLLRQISDDSSVLEVDEKKRGLLHLTWYFVGKENEASVACYRGQLIAVQVIPHDANCMMSVRKISGAAGSAHATAVEKLICD